MARIRDISSESSESLDGGYEEGQRATVMALVDYALRGIEYGTERATVMPAEAMAQARRAARQGVGLGIIWRSYTAAHAQLEGFVIQEADHSGLLKDAATLQRVKDIQTSLLDRVIVSVDHEYESELRRIRRSPDPAGFLSLTPRERSVQELLRLGHKNAEIALTLGISVETVKTHLKNIYRKLGVKSRGQLLGVELSL